MASNRKKQLRVSPPVVKKTVPGKATTPPVEDGLLRMRFGRLDLGGPWCLTKAPDDLGTIMSAVANFETMRVHEVFKGYPGKDYFARDIPNQAARTRLVDLRFDDQERISRLRIGNMGRLYGFRGGLDFWALWWDPFHEIWPTAN